jgi:DNA-binding GntR family transcriptional regulator
LLKLHRETQADQIAGVLRDAILRGDLQPGKTLRQEELAVSIGVSRVPLREALRQLEGEGFVRSDSYKGTYVLSSTAQEAMDALHVRILLELDALAASIKLHTTASINACNDAISAALDDPRIDEHWFDHNWAFHRLLYAPLNRAYLLETIRGCLRKTQLYSWPKHLWTSRQKSCEEHKAILDAITARETAKAKRLLKEHLEVDLRSLQREAQKSGRQER